MSIPIGLIIYSKKSSKYPARSIQIIVDTRIALGLTTRSPSEISFIRKHSRRIAGTKQPCSVCSYPHHSELCHIKAINQFPLHTPVSEINHPNNLTWLCPNHHWEHDAGILPSSSCETLEKNYLTIPFPHVS